MLVLASASPRRQELLRNAGISFIVQPADVDENPLAGESARDCAERLAREKALKVWRILHQAGAPLLAGFARGGNLDAGAPLLAGFARGGNLDAGAPLLAGFARSGDFDAGNPPLPGFGRSGDLDVVLGADTVVVVDGIFLGKPVDGDDAARMLRLLSGRTHQVITGVCLIKAESKGQELRAEHVKIGSESTAVTMSEISDREILDYVATGEPMDKAGAYAIQGIASRWIPRIEGDYSNVVGLPVALVYRMLRE